MSGAKLEKEPLKEQEGKNSFFSKVYKSMIIGASCLAFAGPMKDSTTSKELAGRTLSRKCLYGRDSRKLGFPRKPKCQKNMREAIFNGLICEQLFLRLIRAESQNLIFGLSLR